MQLQHKLNAHNGLIQEKDTYLKDKQEEGTE